MARRAPRRGSSTNTDRASGGWRCARRSMVLDDRIASGRKRTELVFPDLKFLALPNPPNPESTTIVSKVDIAWG